MEERELVGAFVSGARDGSVPGLLIDGDLLYVEGWWHAALRIAPDVHIVRAEVPPRPTAVLELLAASLGDAGLQHVPGGDNPLINAITYVTGDVSGLEWNLWARSAQIGAAAIAQRAGGETVLPGSESGYDLVGLFETAGTPLSDNLPGNRGDISAEFAESLLGGGQLAAVVLAVGLADEQVAGLRDALPTCRLESRAIEEAVSACGIIKPDLVVVDASTRRGRDFLLEFRAEACGRFVPVAAVTAEPVPPGADTTLEPAASAVGWSDRLAPLLP